MTILLVSDYGKDPDEWRSRLRESLPELELRGWPDVGDPKAIEIVLADCPVAPRGGFAKYPKLGWVHYLGHGAGDILRDPTLPAGVVVTRQHRQDSADGLALYVVNALTNHHLRCAEYRTHQSARHWQRLAIRATPSLQVLVLGLGIIGTTIARRLRDLGYAVTAWSRGLHDIEGVHTIAGRPALDAIVGEMDFVIGALPETDETIGLIDRVRLDRMKPGVFLINIGRGTLVVEADLLRALESGRVAGAQLDVFSTEPLPSDHWMWRHPGIIVTPHGGGPPGKDSESIFADIVENYRRFQAGDALLNQTDRQRGY